MLKKNKVASHDQLSGEMLKSLGMNEIQVHWNKVISDNKVPEDSEMNIILHI